VQISLPPYIQQNNILPHYITGQIRLAIHFNLDTFCVSDTHSKSYFSINKCYVFIGRQQNQINLTDTSSSPGDALPAPKATDAQPLQGRELSAIWLGWGRVRLKGLLSAKTDIQHVPGKVSDAAEKDI
jgi:hypothetical protein